MADLFAIKPSERVYEVLHPKTEKPVGLRITMVSMADPKMQKIRRKIQNEKLRLDARGKYFKADDVEENQNELIFGAMTGWEFYNPTGVPGTEGFDPDASLTFKGNVPEFSQKNVIELLTALEWVTNQLSEAISDEKAFF